jgi:peroxisomal membrane protein 4
MSRNIMASTNTLMHRGLLPSFNYFPYLGALTWGLVMYLFEVDPSCLQPSLTSSMTFLYKDSNRPLTHFTQLIPIEKPSLFSLLFPTST